MGADPAPGRVAQLVLQAFGQHLDAGLGDIVGRVARRTGDALLGARIDDRARRALGDHRGGKGVDAVDHAPEIDAQYPFPIGLGIFPNQTACTDTSAVAPATARHRPGNQPWRRVLEKAFMVCTLEVRGEASGVGSLAVVRCDVGTDPHAHALHDIDGRVRHRVGGTHPYRPLGVRTQ